MARLSRVVPLPTVPSDERCPVCGQREAAFPRPLPGGKWNAAAYTALSEAEKREQAQALVACGAASTERPCPRAVRSGGYN